MSYVGFYHDEQKHHVYLDIENKHVHQMNHYFFLKYNKSILDRKDKYHR
jgi:hypothetical protein